MLVLVFIGSLLFFIAMNIPIVFSLVLCAIVMMLYQGTFDSQIIAQTLIDGANSYSLMAIPFFILAGELMNRSGITMRIINFAMGIVGHFKGGLGYVAVITCVIFAGLSGSAVADTAAVATILIPVMASKGYDVNRTTGLIASAGLIAPIIPPSIGFIVFGVITGTSIMQLFMAGIVPGLIIGIVLIITWRLVIRNEDLGVEEKKTFPEVMKLGKDAILALMLPVIIIGGLRLGFFTPTEAGIIAVFYALLIGTTVYRTLKIKNIYEALNSALRTTSIIMFLIGGAMVLSWTITTARLAQSLGDLMSPLIDHPKLLMFAICFVLLLIGMVMDINPSTLILAPLFMPIIEAANIDPVYFGVMFMLTLTIGLITPPVGNVLFVAMSIAEINLKSALKGVAPFLAAEVGVVLLFIIFPDLVLVPLDFLRP